MSQFNLPQQTFTTKHYCGFCDGAGRVRMDNDQFLNWFQNHVDWDRYAHEPDYHDRYYKILEDWVKLDHSIPCQECQ